MENKAKTVALIYCRVSSERQKNEGHGLDSQEHRCREFARNNDYVVEKVFRDSFTGGGDFMKRPAMAEMFGHIDGKPYVQYVVIFDDLKRFARDTVFHIKLRAAFRFRGITLKCLNFNFEETPEGEFVETVLAAGSELERKQNSRQVVQKQKARFEAGYWPLYPPPGYRSMIYPMHGKLLTRVEPEATIIQEALEGFASGRFQEQVDVQRFLTEKDFCKGKPVYLTMVKRLLTRVVYAGYVEYPAWEVSRRKGQHEGLITLETFQKIQDKLNGKVKIQTRKDMRIDFPLRGFVVCSECGGFYTASWSKGRSGKFPYYRCKTAGCIEANKSIRKKDVEDNLSLILKKIKPRASVLSLTKAILQERWNKRVGEFDESLKSVQKEINVIQKDIQVFAELIPRTTSDVVRCQYEKQIEGLSTKEMILKDKLNNKKYTKTDFGTALSEVFKILENPNGVWVNGGLNDKRLVLKLVFADNLVYNREKGFGTANLSLPVRVFEAFQLSNSQGVDMVSESWNQLYPWIFEASEMIVRNRR